MLVAAVAWSGVPTNGVAGRARVAFQLAMLFFGCHKEGMGLGSAVVWLR